MKSILLALIASLICITSWADDSASGCKKPTIPAVQASDVILKLFEKRSKAYQACIQSYVEEKRALAKSTPDPAAATASNNLAEAAVKEFNDYMAELKERNSHTDDGQDAEDDEKNKDATAPKAPTPSTPSRK